MSFCTIPTTGQSLFSIADDEFIVGPGQHGEPGPEGPMKIKSANEVIEDVAGRLIDVGEYRGGLLLIINGSGSTTLMEMFILYNHLEEYLLSRGLKPYKPQIGNFITTQEMGGFQLTMAKADGEIKKLRDAPCDMRYFKITGV